MDDSLDLQGVKICWLECAEDPHTAMCQASHSGMFPVLFTVLFSSCYSILSTGIMPGGLQNGHGKSISTLKNLVSDSSN